MNWMLARLREPSTWRGLIWLLTALGVSLRPEVWEQIIALGMAVAGLIGVLSAEEPKHINVHLPPIDLQGRSDSGPGLPRAIGVRVDVPPGHYTAPDLDERGSPPGFNDQ
jgi:hypothetical protein